MKKVKSIFFYAFVVIGLGAAIWGYLYLRQTKKPSLEALEVLPEKAICVLSSSNFHELTNKLINQNLIWNELLNVSEFKKLSSQLQYFDSLTTEIELIKEFFENRQINLAIYSGKSSYDALITFNLKDLAQEKYFKEAMQTILKCEVNNEGECEFWNGTTRYNLKTASGVVAISESKELTARCFLKQTKKQVENLIFQTLIKNLDNDDLFNMYVNHTLLKAGPNSINTKDVILTGNSVCKIEITPDAFTANGFNDCDSLSILNYLNAQPSQNCDFFHALPFNTINYTAISISNYVAFKKYFNQKSDFWKAVNDSALFNVERQITENVNTKAIEAAYILNGKRCNAMVVEIKDSSLVKEALVFLSDSLFINQNNYVFKLKSQTDNLTQQLVGEFFKTKAAYGFVYGSYLIINESQEEALFYLNSMLNSSSLAQNELFMNYAKDNLIVNFNYQWYSSINKNTEAIRNIFQFVSDTSAKAFNKLSDASINITNYKNLLQFRSNIKYQAANQNKDVPGLWTCEVDTFISSKPGTFINHKSNENEVILQDANNSLYLVNATGNVLWKKQISEPVISEFYTVDAFKNNKFQILFNTLNYIHLIDRNGNYVPGFPVKLPTNVTNAMTLLDYENTKDYRILIACSDHKIYNYNINGSKNDKFTPIKTENEVKSQIKHVKVGASDYLIANDEQGKIYVYSRRGEGRIDLSNKIITDSKTIYIEASNNIQNTKLIYFDDKNSLLESISLVDKKEAYKLGADFENANYYFELIDDDKKMDIVVVDKSKLICYDLTGNELLRFENDESYKRARYFYDSESAYFLLTNNNDEIHLLDVAIKKIIKKIKGNGEPLVYDLFKEGKKYLLVPEGKFLKCVLLK